MVWKKSRERQIETELMSRAYTDLCVACISYSTVSEDRTKISWNAPLEVEYHLFAKYKKMVNGIEVEMACMLDEHNEKEPYKTYVIVPPSKAYTKDHDFYERLGLTNSPAIVNPEHFDLSQLNQPLQFIIIKQYIEAIKTVAEPSEWILTEEEIASQKKKQSNKEMKKTWFQR
ncbi:MAG: hypothetical protein PHN72_01865 [Bacilli bacterium]|nr:hypothetical protein [Bacilli bacterium]